MARRHVFREELNAAPKRGTALRCFLRERSKYAHVRRHAVGDVTISALRDRRIPEYYQSRRTYYALAYCTLAEHIQRFICGANNKRYAPRIEMRFEGGGLVSKLCVPEITVFMKRQPRGSEGPTMDGPQATTSDDCGGEASADSRAPSSPAAGAAEAAITTQHCEDSDQMDVGLSDSQLPAIRLSPIAPFVSKTYGIVNDEPDDIVSWWSSDGEDTFVVKRVNAFQEQVLPRFFSHKKYSSFVRQLNNHGFCRVRSPSSIGGNIGGGKAQRPEEEAQWWEFKHPNFRRGQKGLLSEIKRRKEKKRSNSSASIGASPGLFPAPRVPTLNAKSVDEKSSDGSAYAVRWDLERIRERMQELSSKIDDLKEMVGRLVVCVRDSGVPMALSATTRMGNPMGPGPARVYAPHSGMMQYATRDAQSLLHAQPALLQQPQQQQHPHPPPSMQPPFPPLQAPPPPLQPPLPMPPAPTAQPPTPQRRLQVDAHQQRVQDTEHQTEHQHQGRGQQQERERQGQGNPQQQRHHSQQHRPPQQELTASRTASSWPSSVDSTSLDKSATVPCAQQIRAHGLGQCSDESGRPEGVSGGHGAQALSPSNGSSKKRTREGATTFQQAQPRDPQIPVPNFRPAAGMAQATGTRADGAPEGKDGKSVALVPVQSLTAGVPCASGVYPEAWMENFYPYPVPMRMAGYPFAIQPGLPMRYKVPTPAGAPFLPIRGALPPVPMGSPPFATVPTVPPPRDAGQGHGQPEVPLERGEGPIVMALSTLKGAEHARVGQGHRPQPIGAEGADADGPARS